MSEIFEITLDDLIKDTEPNIDKNNNFFLSWCEFLYLSFILSGCHRAVCSVGCDFKAGCHLRNIVKVAHPADSLRTYALKHLGRSLVDEHFSLTILSHIRALHLAPEHMAHELRAIAQTQHRNTKLEQLVRVGR